MSGPVLNTSPVTQNGDACRSPPSAPTLLCFLPQGYTGPSHLGNFEPVHLVEAETVSPAADGYYLPLWVESNTVQGLGTGVLEGQLPADCVPQLGNRDGEESWC